MGKGYFLTNTFNSTPSRTGLTAATLPPNIKLGPIIKPQRDDEPPNPYKKMRITGTRTLKHKKEFKKNTYVPRIVSDHKASMIPYSNLVPNLTYDRTNSYKELDYYEGEFNKLKNELMNIQTTSNKTPIPFIETIVTRPDDQINKEEI